MPSFNHNFILHVVYSKIDRYATYNTNVRDRTNKGTATAIDRSEEAGKKAKDSRRSAENYRRIGEGVRTFKTRILCCKWSQESFKTKLILLSFKHPNLFYYLMLIDTAFTDMALVINLTTIQNLLKLFGI